MMAAAGRLDNKRAPFNHAHAPATGCTGEADIQKVMQCL
jgi:hypothetical protein